MKKHAVAAVAAACLLAGLFVVEAARAEEWDCSPLADAVALTKKDGVPKLAPMSPAQLDFARGVYAEMPPVGPYPPGDAALLAVFPNGMGGVLFVNGDKTCGRLLIQAPMLKLLVDLEKAI